MEHNPDKIALRSQSIPDIWLMLNRLPKILTHAIIGPTMNKSSGKLLQPLIILAGECVALVHIIDLNLCMTFILKKEKTMAGLL